MATDPSMIFGGDLGMPFQPPAPLIGMDPGAQPPAQMPSAGSPAPSDTLNYIRDTNPEAPQPEAAIDKLKPETEPHRKVIEKLNAMWTFGKDEMKKHYSRFNYAEQRVQAFVSMADYDRLMNETRAQDALPPEPVSVIVPYSYATLHAAATYISSVLLGRKPVFPLMATRGTESERARYMEIALQNHLDYSRGQETLWQLIWDPTVYGFGVIKNYWEERTGSTVKWIAGQRTMATELTFAGNVGSAVDPYAFCPDPRVPMHQCNTRGDFMFCETQISGTVLKDMEKQGSLKHIKYVLDKWKSRSSRDTGPISDNARRVKIGMRAEEIRTPAKVTDFVRVREGTVRLVPKDWGLGDSDISELWKFSWTEFQIIQAEPLGMIHQQHPMLCTEPTSFGHDFMSIAMHDMIGPFQDIISWLVSSRMENVRTAINNQFVADPARVDVNDIRSSAIGRVIRLKQTAMGLPIKDAIMQLLVQDVTSGHIADIQTMRILADTITGVNDNLRGIQTAGGRRSATEARMSMQAGASRLSQLAVRISAQAMLPLVQQMISNIQQFMPDKMWVEMTGDEGAQSFQLTPEMITGSFNYQVSDGTLPYDKQALLEQWKEIMFGVAQDPELRQTYSIPKIFRHVAQLGGAKDIDSFKVAQMPGMGNPFQTGAAMDPGNQPGMVPIGAGMPTNPMGGF